MEYFSKILMPITLQDFKQIYKAKEKIDFKDSFMIIKDHSLSIELKFTEEIELHNIFLGHLEQKKLEIEKKFLGSLKSECLIPLNIVPYPYEEILNKFNLKDEEKLFISSNEYLFQQIKEKTSLFNQIFLKDFFHYVNFVKIKRKISKTEYFLIKHLIKHSNKFVDFGQIISLYDQKKFELLLFYWIGEEDSVFNFKGILENNYFFDPFQQEILIKDQIFVLKRRIFLKYLIKRYKCKVESEDPFILSFFLQQKENFEKTNELFELISKMENFYSFNIYRKIEEIDIKEEFIQNLQKKFDSMDLKVFVDINDDCADINFLQNKKNFIAFNIIATQINLYEFLTSKNSIIRNLTGRKIDKLYVLCENSVNIEKCIEKQQIESIDIKVLERNPYFVIINLSNVEDRYNVYRNLVKFSNKNSILTPSKIKTDEIEGMPEKDKLCSFEEKTKKNLEEEFKKQRNIKEIEEEENEYLEITNVDSDFEFEKKVKNEKTIKKNEKEKIGEIGEITCLKDNKMINDKTKKELFWDKSKEQNNFVIEGGDLKTKVLIKKH